MRVDDPADRLIGQLLDDVEELSTERRELRIHDQHAFRPGEHRGVAAGTDHHVDVAADLLHVHLHDVEVLVLLRDSASDQGAAGADDDGDSDRCCTNGS